ncbi:MAG: CIA30 family protein [Ardenticatenaceae bacterium]|nr:CIA30 family protein [Ardenticatenaceae bacterium]
MKSRKIHLFVFLLLVAFVTSLQSRPAIAASTQLLTDFESGEPTGWFVYSGGGATIATAYPTVTDADPLAQPGQVGDNTFIEATFDVTTGYAGFGQDFVLTGGAQDWSGFTAVSFQVYGTNSGQSYQFEIMDNRSDPANDTAERFDFVFVDDFSGWQDITIPFTNFTRATDYQPAGAPDDGLTLTEMWGFAIILDGSAGTLRLDNIGLERAIVDDFESGLPSGTDGDGNPIGFYKFEGPDAIVSFATSTTPPLPVPGSVAGNNVLQLDTNVPSGSWGGMVHAFENEAVDTWVTQDWSRFVGISFWLYGNNTGSTLFLDVLDNRADGTTGDTAERYSIDLVDDFSGWQYFEIPFDSLNRKEVGNGAPNDGLNLTDVHGWGFGVFSAGQAFTNYIDDVALYGTADVPELAVGFTGNNYNIAEGATGEITVSLNRALGEDDPAQVSVDYSVETVLAEPGRDYVQPPAGTLTFVQGGPSQLSFTLETLDDNKYEGTERVILRLTNPVDVAPGFIMQAAASIVDDEAYDALLLDDFEKGAFLWDSAGILLTTPEIAASDAMALPGQGAYETVLHAVPAIGPSPAAVKAQVIADLSALLPTGDNLVDGWLGKAITRLEQSQSDNYWLNDYYLATDDGKRVFDRDRQAILELMKVTGSNETAVQTAIDQLLAAENTLATLALQQAVANDGQAYWIGRAEAELANAEAQIATGNYDKAARHYRDAWHYAGKAVQGMELAAPTFGRDFALGQDWSLNEGLSFMYYGQGTGDTITLELLDNRAPDPGKAGWSLVWSDEFNDPAGTPPNPENWSYEIGDGTVNGIPGWGNAELQYYTDDPANAATDGAGNLVITARDAEGLTCYYGPCEYTSARLLSANKVEVAYGRIESRIQVPDGEDGLWPAFWSLGTDINEVDWPQTGEIDFMEYVSRIPDEVFGTIHGPGYSGGQSFGDTYNFPGGVAGSFHTYTIEWQPDLIEWYVDGILFHTATPADVAPNEWVFNDPVFILLNMAIGGNFGGAVSPDLTFPQEMVIDYVRVYQGPDTAERFEATFVDDFTGWQEITVPFTAFSRSAEQPAGAPDDGLTLSDVWGYGFKLPTNSATATAMLDQVRLTAPVEATVTNTDDSGPGSLRQAIKLVASNGLVLFDPSLAGSTITLTSGPLVVNNKTVTIDASAAPGVTVSGGGVDRVLVVEATGNATINGLTLADGYGWQLGGGVINNGTLTLDHVTVTNNTMATDAGDYWQGGGGIYSGDGATLNLIDSNVANNTAAWSGGGVYSFFNTTTNIVRSTISGNVSNDVGGGIRALGDVEIVNSTISGNTATGWHGGAIFLTDGDLTITNATIVGNIAPDWAPSTIFVGQYDPSFVPTFTLTNSIIAGNQWYACEQFASGNPVNVVSGGSNVVQDDSCNPVASDIITTDAGVDVLADNGGPTLTHALLAGSVAIDAADTAVCPATDQRGISRDAACDIGAFEFVP